MKYIKFAALYLSALVLSLILSVIFHLTARLFYFDVGNGFEWHFIPNSIAIVVFHTLSILVLFLDLQLIDDKDKSS
jgi:hypothetical protein